MPSSFEIASLSFGPSYQGGAIACAVSVAGG